VSGNSNLNRPLHAASPVAMPGGPQLGNFHEPHPAWGYPTPRGDHEGRAGEVPEQLWRYESTNGEVSTTDTLATIFTASGTPDKWRVVARANGALLVFTNTVDQDEHRLLLAAGETLEVYIPRRRVRAVSATGGAAATLSVEAFFKQPSFAFDAR
jgi:hypothetical protein